MVQVFYNGKDAFSGLAPTPFIGIEDQFINYEDRFGAVKTITLNGNITGNCQNFNYMITAQNTLINNFSRDFKTFEIRENNQIIYQCNFTRINSIDFESSKYVNFLPFSINLTAYPADLFTGTYGVIDPTNNINYTESQDGTVSVKRSFSAKGINTNSTANNALANAISYVQSLTGQSMILPNFITGPSVTLTPRNISETVNRMDSSYSIDIDYIYRKNATSNTIISYTIDIGYGEEEGFYNVTFKGNMTAPIGYAITSLRSDFNNFKQNIFSLSLSKFTEITNNQYLNDVPLNFNISENELENTIDFSYAYNSEPYLTKFDYSPSLSYDNIKDLYEISINGTLKTRREQKQREQLLENALAQINIRNLAQNFYIQNANTSISGPLNLNPKSYQIKRNKTQPEISITAQFDNTPTPPSQLKSFKYNISIDRSFYIHNPIQFLNGDNGAFKMNFYKRGSVSVRGSATASSAGLSSIVRNKALSLLNFYASSVGAKNRVRVEDNVNESLQSDEQGFSYSFNLTDSCETSIVS